MGNSEQKIYCQTSIGGLILVLVGTKLESKKKKKEVECVNKFDGTAEAD